MMMRNIREVYSEDHLVLLLTFRFMCCFSSSSSSLKQKKDFSFSLSSVDTYPLLFCSLLVFIIASSSAFACLCLFILLFVHALLPFDVGSFPAI